MGISLWLVWKAPSTRPKTTAYVIFGLQLFVNLVWSLLFFSLRCPLCGFADIVILLALIATTIVSFYRITPLAGYLLIPYLLWVTYATTLNAAIVILNHQ
jgi:tryptophan-rich sensory protein